MEKKSIEEINLKDIADDLLILPKITIDKLFQLDNASDCISLYMFYYKTAKWQKTNQAKAKDEYVRRCLKWGTDKIKKTKQTLKENGLIEIVQRRENGKIKGWYVKVSYLITQRKIDEIKIKVENTDSDNNNCFQEVDCATSCNEKTNALIEKNKYLKKENKMLKDKIVILEKQLSLSNNRKSKNSNNKEQNLIVMEQMIDNITTNEELRDILKIYLKVRNKKGLILEQWKVILEDFVSFVNENYSDESMDFIIQLVRNAISGGWKALCYPEDYNNY